MILNSPRPSRFSLFACVIALLTFPSSRSIGSTIEQAYGFHYWSPGPNSPEGAIVQGPDGALYGTTFNGGSAGLGTAYRVTTNGVVTTLASFTGTNGSAPQGGLVLGGDRVFYGTTSSGGVSNVGTVFKIDTNGHLSTLISFNNTNGAAPLATLLEGPD